MLFYDITRQARLPVVIASVDATNFYDRIAHAMASLIFQAFSMPATTIKCMLKAMENMKFFLQTAFGKSTSFAGSSITIKAQCFCQGNGAALADRGVISMCILRSHNKKGQGAKVLCPISKLKHHLSDILYVNDTDLLHINLTKDKSEDKVHTAI